jgi:hypothetical protein
MMKKNIFVTMTAMALAVSAMHAQNLDPTVVVNRAYEGRLTDVHKPLLDMQVPDSVTRFDLDFDYSVFDKPYKGAYEFQPYLLTMQPASSVQAPKQLYLRAGAGYTLHPSLDLVWAVPMKGAFRMDAYAFHRSYVGEYRKFKPELAEGETAVIERMMAHGGDRTNRQVYYDLETRVGADGSYDWNSGVVTFDASYYGLASEDFLKTRHYDALDVKAGIASKHYSPEDYFMYDVDVRYRFGVDAIDYDSLDEHVFSVKATLGQVMNRVTGTHNVLFDAGLDLAAYSHSVYSTVAGQFYITPRYVYDYRKWRVDAGVKLAKVMRSDSPEGIFASKEQIVYPDVYASFDAIPQYLRVYTELGGGNRMNTYSSLLEENHHFDVQFGRGRWQLMDFSVERVSAMLGFKGRVSKFAYDLRGGYVNYANAPLDAVVVAEPFANGSSEYLPGIGYTGYQKAFAAASLGWNSEALKFDADIQYDYAFGITEGNGLFAPAALTGQAAFEYNWSRRIYAGVDCIFATERKGSVLNLLESAKAYDAVIPGWADLGLYFEYAFSNSFSLWARGGNLLNMTIQRNPLYAEKGVNFTVGICLNL